ncbi:hypothetical protein MMC10_004372 [Thelotrema lepadinum]|nr:hypothetical protein [Thelotrema lepadinum]
MKLPSMNLLLHISLAFPFLLSLGTATAISSTEAAYHVIYSYTGPSPPSGLVSLISQGLVGGLILFGDNIASNTSAVLSSLQSTYASSPAYAGSPLLIMTDQEGGEVRRLPGGPSLSEKDIGSSSYPPRSANAAGQQAAQALDAYNVNSNLAPVLDVFRTPGNFIDEFQRSYSNDSSIAASCGEAFIAAQQSAGVVATAKHFPGLGAAKAGQDTDAEPVTINLSLSQLRSVDEAPYVNAIQAGVDMVMTSWALYPALDSKYPSGLSSKWIQGELRGRLGYKGVTISDAIEAGGLRAFGSDEQRAVQATKAGLDLILAASGDWTQGQGIVDALVQAVGDGVVDAGAFGEGTQRILSLRGGL